tara:strand:+ start:263 stop:826 length:564 start_codon:yes stop_codon:yes gene_type:complete
MRIISGSFKGKKILQPKDIKTRPLKDLTKESIFNILSHSNKFQSKISGSTILDLFSGVGSFGLECLSRGAKHVTFIENYKGVLPILKKNLLSLKLDKNYHISEHDILKGINLNNNRNKFDIIFIDPPYKYKNLEKIIDNIYEKKLLKNNGIMIIHRHRKEKEDFSKKIKILDEKKYGISKILFASLA